MKISNSKKQLAKIIHENGGWPVDAESAAQCISGEISFWHDTATKQRGEDWCGSYLGVAHDIQTEGQKLPNWHQTILSREEYFHLYPAPDAARPLAVGDRCVVAELGGAAGRITALDKEGSDFKYQVKLDSGLITWAYDAALSTTPEPVVEAKPTIEQLAADYRNRKDYADRKQQEADVAKADAEAKLVELVAAGTALGLVLSVEAPEPELVITDWRDLRVGDVIEYVDGRNKNRVGMVGRIDSFDLYNADTDRPVRMVSDNGQVGWPTKWRFTHRPAKGGADNA